MKIVELLQCPQCRVGTFSAQEDFWQCEACHRFFPIYQGAPLLQKEASELQTPTPSVVPRSSKFSSPPQRSFFSSLYGLAAHTPFVPFFSELFFTRKGLSKLLQHAKGTVLEIGCGDQAQKKQLPLTCEYIPTDYVGWGEALLGGSIQKNIFLPAWQPAPLVWADAASLPFRDGTIDTWMAIETLEHVPVLDQVLQEAGRVLKPDGICLISIPWMYLVHGGHDDVGDYARYTKNAMTVYAKRAGLSLEEEFCNTSLLQTLVTAVNQYIVRLIFDNIRSSLIQGVCGFLVAPIFFVSNVLALIFRGANRRFATRYFFILRKPVSIS